MENFPWVRKETRKRKDYQIKRESSRGFICNVGRAAVASGPPTNPPMMDGQSARKRRRCRMNQDASKAIRLAPARHATVYPKSSIIKMKGERERKKKDDASYSVILPKQPREIEGNVD